MKFKVGDKVKIREDLSLEQYETEDKNKEIMVAVNSMLQYSGKIATIEEIVDRYSSYRINLDNKKYYWSIGMFEKEEDYSVELPSNVIINLEMMNKNKESLVYGLQFSSPYRHLRDYIYGDNNVHSYGNFSIDRMELVVKALKYGWKNEKTPEEQLKDLFNSKDQNEKDLIKEVLKLADKEGMLNE